MRAALLAAVLACACTRAATPARAPAPAAARGDEDLVSAMAPLMPADAMKDFDWKPEVSASPAESVFSNAKLMPQLRADRFMVAMMAMKASIGVTCEHCHDLKNYPAEDKGPKQRARRMLLMARDLNDHTFGGKTRVTCWTCHRGDAKPPSGPDGFEALLAARPASPSLAVPEGMADKPARKVWKNLKVLGGRPSPSLAAVMNAFTITLGVECSHCHVDNDFASDAKPAKERARDMMRMVNRGGVVGGVQASCFTCHRGKIDVPRLPTAG